MALLFAPGTAESPQTVKIYHLRAFSLFWGFLGTSGGALFAFHHYFHAHG